MNIHNSQSVILLPRTDFLNQHINGQGNFGFCSPSCTAQPALPDTVSRSKFEVAAGVDTAVNLPDSGASSAVVFSDGGEEAIQLPPS